MLDCFELTDWQVLLEADKFWLHYNLATMMLPDKVKIWHFVLIPSIKAKASKQMEPVLQLMYANL